MQPALREYLLWFYSHLLPENHFLVLRHTYVEAHTRDNTPSHREKVQEKFGDAEAVNPYGAFDPEAFLEECAELLLRDRAAEIVLNYCAVCGGLARTPQAKQCRHCGHDWH